MDLSKQSQQGELLAKIVNKPSQGIECIGVCLASLRHLLLAFSTVLSRACIVVSTEKSVDTFETPFVLLPSVAGAPFLLTPGTDAADVHPRSTICATQTCTPVDVTAVLSPLMQSCAFGDAYPYMESMVGRRDHVKHLHARTQ